MLDYQQQRQYNRLSDYFNPTGEVLEYILPFQQDVTNFLLKDQRVKTCCVKTGCVLDVRKQIVHRRFGEQNWMKFVIVRLMAPNLWSAERCNLMLERINTIYAQRKPYQPKDNVTFFAKEDCSLQQQRTNNSNAESLPLPTTTQLRKTTTKKKDHFNNSGTAVDHKCPPGWNDWLQESQEYQQMLVPISRTVDALHCADIVTSAVRTPPQWSQLHKRGGQKESKPMGTFTQPTPSAKVMPTNANATTPPGCRRNVVHRQCPPLLATDKASVLVAVSEVKSQNQCANAANPVGQQVKCKKRLLRNMKFGYFMTDMHHSEKKNSRGKKH